MNLEKLIAEVLELDKKATPGPWSWKRGNLESKKAKKKFGGGIQLVVSEDYYPPQGYDQALIAHYRSAAPKLAKACQVMMGQLTELSKFNTLEAHIDNQKIAKGIVEFADITLAEVEKILC